MNGRIAIFVLALVSCACQSVPDVTYDDGGADTGVVTNTCPDNAPPYASWCCGPIACSGPNCVPTCSDCMLHCSIFDLCCPNAQNRAVCRADAQACP